MEKSIDLCFGRANQRCGMVEWPKSQQWLKSLINVYSDDAPTGLSFNEMEEKQLILWENMIADENMRRFEAAEKQQIDNRVRDTSDRSVSQLVCNPSQHAPVFWSHSRLLYDYPGSSSITKLCICFRVDLIARKVDEMAESNFMMQSGNSTTQPKLPPVLDDRINYLEEQVCGTSWVWLTKV